MAKCWIHGPLLVVSSLLADKQEDSAAAPLLGMNRHTAIPELHDST